MPDSSSTNAEQQLLCAMMLSYDIAEQISDLYPEHFESYSHQLIFAAAKKLIQAGGSAPTIAVEEQLRENGSLETAGGGEYLSEIIDTHGNFIPTIEELAPIIKKKHRLRQITEAAETAIRAASGHEVDLAYAESRTRSLLKLLEERKQKTTNTTSALTGITEHASSTFKPSVQTGWETLDSLVKFAPGRLIVLGARPGTGKTTLATQLSAMMINIYKCKVLYCSVEMDAAEIGLKALSMLTGTDCVSAFEAGDEEGIKAVFARAGQHSPVLNNLHVLFNTRMDKLCNTAITMKKNGGLDMVVVDFITSMQPNGAYGTKSESVGAVSKALKAMARDLDVPVLACSQLNRGTAANRRPSMKDLRDSGEIEQDADVVILLNRTEEEIGGMPITELIVEKNRFGSIADLRMRSELRFHRFYKPWLT